MKKLVSILAGNPIVLPSFVLLLTLILTVAACDQGDQGGQTYPTPTATRPPTPTPKPSATVLLSQEITPSDQEQIVSWKDQLKVTIPAGLVDSKQTLTIATAPDLPANPFKGFGPLLAFDVSLGSLHNFKKQLTIEVVYDPSKIVSDLPPEKALRAAYWNAEAKTWVSSRVQVDTRRNVVIIRTDHLTSWKVHYLRRGYGVHETDRFTIVYEKTVQPTVNHVDQDPDSFAKQMGNFMDSAWSQYISKGYLPRPNDKRWTEYESIIKNGPPAEIHTNPRVVDSDPPRIVVFIDQNTSESQTKLWSGDIYLKTNYLSLDEVRHDAAHELFHDFQSEASSANYLAKRWWMEATADYVADKVAWGGINTMAQVLEDYFRFRLDYQDGIHDYSTSRFVDYLVRKGVDFKRLWDATVASKDPSAVNFLDAYLRSTTKAPLRDHYKAFAEYVLFDRSSPLELAADSLRGPMGKSGRIGGGVVEDKAPEALPADKNEISYSFGLNSGFTAGLWGFTAANKDPKSPRALKVELLGSIPDVDASIYVLKNDQRPQGGVASNPSIYKGTINSNKKSLNLSVAADEVVYILAVNTSDTLLSVTVKVSGFAISPPAASVNAGQSVTFTTPGVTERVLWSVQEGPSGGSISASGVYTAPANSGTYHVVATLESDRTRSASATVTVGVPAPSVAQGVSGDLQKTKLFGVKGLWYAASETTQDGRTGPTASLGTNFESDSIPITWNGTSFSGRLVTSGKVISASTETTQTVSGTVTPNGSAIITVQYSYLSKTFHPKSEGWSKDWTSTTTRQLTLQNVPLSPGWGWQMVIGEFGGASVPNYISNFSYIESQGPAWDHKWHMPVTAKSDSYLQLYFGG